MTMPLNQALLSLLVCPHTGAPLKAHPTKAELWCQASGLAYPIENGIPQMLIEKARPLTQAEKEQDLQPRK